jgi:two-component system, cell cycle sensor histidine kinase and response regulator CckA
MRRGVIQIFNVGAERMLGGGPELLSRLQVDAPHLKVLYMSGYTAQSTANKTGIDRGLPFLQKPFTAAGLVKHVRDALDRKASDRPA